jgi:His/Glu/Gln/Arg/opine family amino acid ABC transporter permease subunit
MRSGSSLFCWAALAGSVAVLAAGPGAGLAAAREDSLAQVQRSRVLRVAVDPTYPPMAFEQNGTPVGFDIDLAKELARRLGVRAEFVVSDWAGIIAGLHAGRYDVIISSMNITPERQLQVDFIEYLALSQVFVCRRGVLVHTERDLEDKIVAVQVNTTSHSWVEGLSGKRIHPREVKALPTPTDAFTAVRVGQADVSVADEPVGRYYARADPALVVTGQAMEAEPVGIALGKHADSLRTALAGTLAAMKEDGSLRSLTERWFSEEASRPQTGETSTFWGFSRIVLPRILQGMLLTLELTVMSSLCGITLGLGLALARISRSRLLSRGALVYVTLFRGTPLLLQIFFIFYALPPLLGIRPGALLAGILALALNMAAYVSEIMRAAIESIDKGQMEAARSLGLSRRQALWWVVLPQAWRRMVPPLVNELAALSKDTSLVSVLALHEMLYETNRLAAAYLRPWEVYVWAGLGYLMIVLTLTFLAGRLEKRLEVAEA